MRRSLLPLILCGIGCVGFQAHAQERFAPGSLLIFPEFDNRAGVASIITVTNTNPLAEVETEFVYIGAWDSFGQESDCLEYNRVTTLTPNDTFTALTNAHNPNQEQGFLYVFAREAASNEAYSFNHLIGTFSAVDGLATLAYTIEPFVFRTPVPEGEFTDLDGDGDRDLNDVEYAAAPDRLLFPRFIGQQSLVQSDLILLNLTGGGQFTAVADFLVYNDNEEVFSSAYAFKCWERVRLLDIDAVFNASFLATLTDHDPNEVFGSAIETGWFEVDGGEVYSSLGALADPAILGYLVERVASGQAADLPFVVGSQPNGVLYPPTPGLRDCDDDGIPDSQETDCNGNSVPDECELATGFANDCNQNGVPDDCEEDCDQNGVADDCENLADCNGDGLPDACDPGANDCNQNGIPDECENDADCNANGVLDDCDPDCDQDGIPDDCRKMRDCDSDGVPDVCEPDCDLDGVPDDCEEDCNRNGIADDCEGLPDCDGNGVPDPCQKFQDCNANNVPDQCEGPDCNANGVPDECEVGQDCDDNGVPDQCQPDCNGDGFPDVCNLLFGTPDCDDNGTPDDCDPDCDADGIPDACEEDCNQNGLPDDCEALTDCNGNGIPDECEPGQDCNQNGIPDVCDPDCDSNGLPDDCELAGGAPDCNENGVPDVCDGPDCDNDRIPDECEEDCNQNGTPDDCEAFTDCNFDNVPDECQLASDCNGNGVLDLCEPDCDGNGVPDDCDLTNGLDCNLNGVLDACEPDCDNDGLPDECESDCDSNGVPDDCQSFQDCNDNSVPDSCEPDCNHNQLPDDCDIAFGLSMDANGDGVPDECAGMCPPEQTMSTTETVAAFSGIPAGGPLTVFVPQFDDSNGRVLTQAVVSWSGTLSGDYGFENQDIGSGCSTDVLSNMFSVLSSPAVPQLSLALNIDAVESTPPLAAFDGTIDFSGPSGVQGFLTPVSQFDIEMFTDAASLAAFTGTGDLPFDFDLFSFSAAPGGCSNFVFQATPQAELFVNVTYTWCEGQ